MADCPVTAKCFDTVGWVTARTFCQLSAKVLFRNKWKKVTKWEPADLEDGCWNRSDPVKRKWLPDGQFGNISLFNRLSVWNPATILQMRLSVFTGCVFQSGSITSSLSWRTKCYLDVHQVTSGHLSASSMCLVVEHSAPPTRITSWCRQSRPVHHRRQSRLLSRSPTDLEFSTRRRYLRWIAANLPEKAKKTSILSVVSWLLLVTFTPAVELAVAVPLRPL